MGEQGRDPPGRGIRRLILANPTPYPGNRRPILATDALSDNRRPILATDIFVY